MMLPSATRGRSISPQHHHTPKEEFTQRRENILLSEIFPEKYIDFIDEEIFEVNQLQSDPERVEPSVTRNSCEMPKKRKSRILDDDEFREAYGFVRKNSMTHSQTKILTRQKKVSFFSVFKNRKVGVHSFNEVNLELKLENQDLRPLSKNSFVLFNNAKNI